MSNDYYIYIYLNPLKNNRPFYIGKGKDKRKYSHLYEKLEKTSNPHKINTILKIIKETGKRPPIEIYRSALSSEDAFYLEKELIDFYGRKNNNTGILCNLTDGGMGGVGRIISETERKNISKRMSEPKSEQHKINNGIAKKGKIVVKDKDGNKFSVNNDDVRWTTGELMGVSKGKKMSEDQLKNIIKSKMGRHWWNNGVTNKFCRDQPEGFHLGRINFDIRENISNRIISEETREKHRQNSYKRKKDNLSRFLKVFT
jgi:hypothetical protein